MWCRCTLMSFRLLLFNVVKLSVGDIVEEQCVSLVSLLFCGIGLLLFPCFSRKNGVCKISVMSSPLLAQTSQSEGPLFIIALVVVVVVGM